MGPAAGQTALGSSTTPMAASCTLGPWQLDSRSHQWHPSLQRSSRAELGRLYLALECDVYDMVQLRHLHAWLPEIPACMPPAKTAPQTSTVLVCTESCQVANAEQTGQTACAAEHALARLRCCCAGSCCGSLAGSALSRSRASAAVCCACGCRLCRLCAAGQVLAQVRRQLEGCDAPPAGMQPVSALPAELGTVPELDRAPAAQPHRRLVQGARPQTRQIRCSLLVRMRRLAPRRQMHAAPGQARAESRTCRRRPGGGAAAG